MTIIEAMFYDLPVESLRRWTKGRHDRTYVRAAGYSERYRGCKSHQLYWDHHARALISRFGAGTCPRDYLAAVHQIESSFAEAESEAAQ